MPDSVLVIFDASNTLFDPASEELLPGVKELLGEIAKRGAKLCVASGGNAEYITSILNSNGISDMFAAVVGFDDSELHSERLKIAVDRAFPISKPARVFSIDDRASRAPVAAKLGIKPIIVSDPRTFESSYPVFKDLVDTQAIIRAIFGKS